MEKTTTMDRAAVRRAIERLELAESGLLGVECQTVQVRNLRLRKTMPATADIVMISESGRTVMRRGVQYETASLCPVPATRRRGSC